MCMQHFNVVAGEGGANITNGCCWEINLEQCVLIIGLYVLCGKS